MNKVQIYCVNESGYIDVEGGTTLGELVGMLGDSLGFDPICARVNNKTENLSFQLFAPKMVEFLRSDSPSGRRVYVRSLCMILYRAISDLMPGIRLCIEHSVSRGYYCRLSEDSKEYVPTPAEVESIERRMRELVEQDLPFVREEKLTRDVLPVFRQQGLEAKCLLLETTRDLYTPFYRLGDLADSYYGPLAPSTGMMRVFALRPYKEGMLLLAMDGENPMVAATPSLQEKMYKAFTDYLKFNRTIKVSNVGELNRTVLEHKTARLINVAEAMHDKLLGRISDEILRRRQEGGARIILIAGPSSSGKTTSTKRLAIQLMTNLITPKMISLDDYFVDRESTPRDENGDYDFEALHALDLARLESDLNRLLAGEEINLPTYSFEYGRRIEKERPLRLEENDVLMLEGIHGLNPALLPNVDPSQIYKIYVSALTTLHIDDHNWISTTDTRLLRRIVRDHKYRHTTAVETIRRWPSVRRGEEKWIFPFQENADATFNSSLLFELGVMKSYAEPLLKEVPHDCPEYSEAYRLLKFLSYFLPIPAEQIPSTSLLREFLGGSSFKY